MMFNFARSQLKMLATAQWFETQNKNYRFKTTTREPYTDAQRLKRLGLVTIEHDDTTWTLKTTERGRYVVYFSKHKVCDQCEFDSQILGQLDDETTES